MKTFFTHMTRQWACILAVYLCVFTTIPIDIHCAIAAESTPSAPAKKEDTAEPASETEDPWAAAWSSQQQFMKDVVDDTTTLRRKLPTITKEVINGVLPFEQQLQQDFVMGTTYGRNPRLLEAVERRIVDTADRLRTAMAPAKESHTQAKELLTKILQLERTIPTDVKGESSVSSSSLRKYASLLAQTRTQLEDIISRLENAMTQGNMLYEKASSAIKEIDVAMPKVWATQYIVAPIRYLDNNNLLMLREQVAEMATAFILRMSMEMPQTTEAWIAVGLRFLTTLFFGLIMAFVVYRKLGHIAQPEIYAHIFRTSVPWLLVGLSVVVASFTTTPGAVYRMLLSIGNLLLIVGQISLAWDLRRITLENAARISPFWPLCMPTLVAYILLYPDMPLFLLGVLWIFVLVISLVWQRTHPVAANCSQFERVFLQTEPIILWASLMVTVFGFPRHAILLYLIFAMSAVSLQLCIGSLRLIHTSTEKLGEEGSKAVLNNMLVAFTAPLTLVLILGAMAMWILTLPGGFYLLRHYSASGINIGTTHFNFAQLLLIISGFYVTRAVISIGGSVLRKMPDHGIRIDRSLLPPIQTAFTYAIWALFGLFVLNALGLDLKSLAVVAGGLSVGIGFGMQTIVNNFLSGLILIFSRSLQEGDVIELGGLNGIVRKINVRATTVETFDNAVIYVPNSEFVANRIINWTRNSRSIRTEIAVGVAYGTDPTLVMRLLRETADASPDVLKYPQPSVLFANFGDSTLDFKLRFWVNEYGQGVPTASNIRLALEKVFREHDVEVAFPQLDVHIKDMPRQIPQKSVSRAAPVSSAVKKTPLSTQEQGGANSAGTDATITSPASANTGERSKGRKGLRRFYRGRRLADPPTQTDDAHTVEHNEID